MDGHTVRIYNLAKTIIEASVRAKLTNKAEETHRLSQTGHVDNFF